MKFAMFCRKISIALLVLVCAWLFFVFPYTFTWIGFLILLSTGIISLLIYGMGCIIAELRFMNSMMMEQKDNREELLRNQETLREGA